MNLLNATLKPVKTQVTSAMISLDADAELKGSRFAPDELVGIHLGEIPASSLGALDVKFNILDERKMTSFLLSGALVVWVISGANTTIIFLPTEYREIREIVTNN